MPLNPAMWAMTLAESALWTVLALFFWRKQLQKRFPAMGGYLLLHTVSSVVLLALMFIQTQPGFERWFGAYFFTYWSIYIASSVLLFFVSLEVFQSALAGFTGLMRLGTVIFRWAALASVILSLTTLSFAHIDIMLLPEFGFKLMRSVSVMELCLLAFLCISLNALHLSMRDLCFGIALGFGILSSSDFILAAVLSRNSTLTDTIQFVGVATTIFVLGLWITYAGLPEPARKPVVVSANSTIYRWNEIASALGHKGANVAVQQPANSFFLTDVEKVVEKVLTRTLKERESNS